MVESWAECIKTQIAAFVKDRLNSGSKTKTAGNAHLMESLLDDWLKNNHISNQSQ